MQPQFAYQQPQVQQHEQQHSGYAPQQFVGQPVSQSPQQPTQQFASQPTSQLQQTPTQQPQQVQPQQYTQSQQPQLGSQKFPQQRAELGIQPTEQRIQSLPQPNTDPYGAALQPTTVQQQPIGTQIPIQQQPTTTVPQYASSMEPATHSPPVSTSVGAQGEFARPQGMSTPSHQQAAGQVVQQPTSEATEATQSGEMGVQQGMQSQERAMGELRGIPSVDILETPDEIRVFADVPGYDSDDVEVLCDDSTLTILARRDTEEEEDATWIQRERATEIQREFQLPARALVDEAEATCENGVCTITLPKSEEGRQKRIGFQ